MGSEESEGWRGSPPLQFYFDHCVHLCVCDRKPQFANLVTHPGFSEQLCYGDVSLRFMYTWSQMSKHDRELILRQNDGLSSPPNLTHNISNTAAQSVMWLVFCTTSAAFS